MERTKSLKIGALWDDGFVSPTPPVTRALKETVEKLKAAGHEIVTWPSTVRNTWRCLFLADGGKSARDLLEPTGEKSKKLLEGNYVEVHGAM